MDKVVGESVKRIDALDKVLGRAKFPADLYVEGMLHAKVLWSERPHARIVRMDTSRAESYPSVVAVLTARDMPVNEFGISEMDQRVLAEGKVRSVGDPVALVIAETEAAAAAAKELISVDYEDLPVISDPREAMEPGSPLVHEERGSNILAHYRVRKGDVERAFAQADVVVEGYYHTPHQEHAYLQPEAGLGLIDEEGKVVVYTAGQWAFDDRRQIAHALDLPEDRVRVVYTAIGGAFGGREDISLQILIALAVWKTECPVKLVYSREESIQGHHKRHPFYMRYRTGATREGKLLALEAELIADAGAYASTSAVVLANAVAQATGPYEIPNVKVDGYAVHTHNLLTGAFRAFGAPQVNFAINLQMEKLAEALGMDPVELRMRNVLREGSKIGTDTTIPAGVGIGETLRQAALAAG
ncbi:MAG: xanthine dehydrogenase family protein molybdopterin-binding subunit, partial [Dehalococcoidia bacterium]